jgi:hypothetical protein
MALSICYPINQGKWYSGIVYKKEVEVFDTFPHPVRRCLKFGYEIIEEEQDKEGYVILMINGPVGKHRVVGQFFVENDCPEAKTQVNHINFIRNDNRVENLEWVTPEMNMMKRQCSGNWIDDPMPREQLFRLQEYKGSSFFKDRIYFDLTPTFYRYFDGKDHRACALICRMAMENTEQGQVEYGYVKIKDDFDQMIMIKIPEFVEIYSGKLPIKNPSKLLIPFTTYQEYEMPPNLFLDREYNILQLSSGNYERIHGTDKAHVKIKNVMKNGHEIREIKVNREILPHYYNFK